MYIEALGPGAFSLLIPADELPAPPGDMTRAQALSLLSSLPGMDPERSVVELFPGRCELLILVSPSGGPWRAFSFPGFEELLAAAGACPLVPSSLYLYEGEYILAAAFPEVPPAILWEFGEERDCSPHILCHLAEHGRCLIPSGALAFLCRRFLNNI